ncbi:MAG: hypothetical protein CL581_11000 [Alteromonadaceae bacterium]|nr:hypothetical protein [Alteromonadaceae bacterium]MAA65290.1 hypothetical protein [Alteromonadaceae bacterium]
MASIEHNPNGFRINFANGFMLSIGYGEPHQCENRMRTGDNPMSRDFEFQVRRDGQGVPLCVSDPDDEFRFDETVRGYVPVEHLDWLIKHVRELYPQGYQRTGTVFGERLPNRLT